MNTFEMYDRTLVCFRAVAILKSPNIGIETCNIGNWKQGKIESRRPERLDNASGSNEFRFHSVALY